jgi:uncharacterized protein YecT (DUF1311 family)
VRLLVLLTGLAVLPAAAHAQGDCAAPADAAAAVACAAEAARMADEDMDLAYGMAKARADALSGAGVTEAPALLETAQTAWDQQRQATCTLEAAVYRGDPAEAAVADRCRERMARARTEDLRLFGEVN